MWRNEGTLILKFKAEGTILINIRLIFVRKNPLQGPAQNAINPSALPYFRSLTLILLTWRIV